MIATLSLSLVLLTATPTPAETPSEATLERIGAKIVAAFEARDAKAFEALIDYDALIRRILDGTDLPEEIAQGLKLGFKKTPLATNLLSQTEPDTIVSVLRVRSRSKDSLIRLRLLPSEGVNYIDCIIEGQGSRPRISDFYMYLGGETVSATMRRTLLQALGAKTPSLVERLLGKSRAAHAAAYLGALKRIPTLLAGGDPEGAMAVYRALPETLRQDRTLLIWRTQIAAQLNDAEYLAALDAIRKQFPDDPRLDFLLLDGLILREKYDEAIRGIDRLQEAIGGDAYLTYLHGVMLHGKGETAASRAKAHQALREEPDLEAPIWHFIELALEDEDHAETILWLEKLEALGWELELEGVEVYAKFLRSKEYAEWQASRVHHWRGKPLSFPPKTSLPEARKGFRTDIVHEIEFEEYPAPKPPKDVFEIVRYTSPAGKLAGYLTPDPGDGRKRPAVVWAHGGFGGIGEWLWKEPQFTRAFRDAGFVVFCPSWRGENDNPGRFELFYGEVDDAVAAVEFVARQPHVDRRRVYIAGHSTGGTIALLTAQSSKRVRAAFSFGGAPDLEAIVADGEGYGNTPFDHLVKDESFLRSPIHFVGAVKCRTFYFEGAESFYVPFAQTMEKRARELDATFRAYAIKGGDHFNILAPLTALIADRIRADTEKRCNIRFRRSSVEKVLGAARAK